MMDEEILDAGRCALEAARLAGGSAAALVVRRAIGVGVGPWGSSDPQSLALEGALVVLVGVVVAGLLRRRPGAMVGAFVLTATNLGLMIPVFPFAPVPVALAMLWLTALLARWLVPEVGGRLRAFRRRSARRYGTPDQWEDGARHLVGAALVVAVAVLGYGGVAQSGADRLGWIFGLAAVGTAAPGLLRRLRSGKRWPIVAFAAAALAVAAVRAPALALGLVVLALVVTLIDLMVRLPAAEEILEFILARPAVLTWVSFVVLIAVGTFLLSLPVSSTSNHALTPMVALFTATSAACVTGLIVVDTARDLSVFGQVVVLGLIQVGGLSIMVLSGFAVIAVGETLGLRGESALREVLDQASTGAAHRLVAFVIGATLLIEAVGAVLLSLAGVHEGLATGQAIWEGVFHSISAFCNAGFALYSDSVVSFSERPLVLMTLGTLIVLGGLGFPVLGAGWARLRGRRSAVSRLQVRLVLLWSAGLALVGFVWFAAVEWNGALAQLAPGHRLVSALFQSVTLRTAGFNSVPFDGLGPATLLLMIVMMVIGAAPGGTGGGLKITTVAVLLGSIPAAASGRRHVVLGRRSIPPETFFRCAAIAGLGLVVLMGGSLALLLFEGGTPMSLLFEAASAVGTVGLTLGATAKLDLIGRSIVILMMFLGRVGPLSLAMVLAGRKGGRVEYPETRLMVG